jgi:Ca2+-binding RTX toxin-like protein
VAEYKLTPDQLGSYEGVLKKGITGDGIRGTEIIIDSDINKNEYTRLILTNNSNTSSLRYALRLRYADSNVPLIFSKNQIPFRFISPNVNPFKIGLNAMAAAEDLNGDIDIIWKDTTTPTDSLSVTKFQVFGTQAGQQYAEPISSLRSLTASEVAAYEPQFDEDLNKDGLIGVVTPIEENGNASVLHLASKDEYRIRDNNGQTIKLFDQGNALNQFSAWKPIAAEVILGAIGETNQPYYQLITENLSGAYSFWLVNKNGNKLSEKLLNDIDMPLYEAEFKQDFNGDSSVHQVDEIVEANSLVSLIKDQFGYSVSFGNEKLYIKSVNGIVNDTNAGGFLEAAHYNAGYQIIKRTTDGANFDLLYLDQDGSIINSQRLQNSDLKGYQSTFRQDFKPIINGTSEDDTIITSAADDIVNGGEGNDTILDDLGDDVIDGGADNDFLYAKGGNNYLAGGSGEDTLHDDPNGIGLDTKDNKLSGGEDNDTYYVYNYPTTKVIELPNEGIDTVHTPVDNYNLPENVENLVLLKLDNVSAFKATGNNLDNIITGNSNNNSLNGLSGNDTIDGADGNDTLIGGMGNDSLIGGTGNDILTGGMGNDILTGGMGSDTFAFLTRNEGIDIINDFNSLEDRISVYAATFGGGLKANTYLPSHQFVLGMAAKDTDDRFIYDQTDGSLYYDFDGSGSMGQIKLAILNGSPSITSQNIWIS